MADRKKILVVDDEPDFLELVKVRLNAAGYDIITSLNGKEALLKIKESRPDAVLLDILMPGMDGLEVLKRIRKADKNLPVYIITAFSTEERFKLANKFGASGFIVKTDDLGAEIESISSALDIASRYKSAR